MSWSPLLDQRPLIPDGSEDCFEACLWMVLQHLGHDVNIQDILADHAGATDLTTAVAMCQTFGLTGVSETQGGFTNDDNLVIALIHDNGYANPDVTGPFEHYIVVYAQDAVNIAAANPWGARDILYPLSEFNPAYIAAINIPISANTVSGGTTTMDNDLRAALASIVEFLSHGGVSQPQYANVASIVEDVDGVKAGYQGMVQAALASPAVQQTWQTLQSGMAGPAGAQGPEGPPGPPGPPGMTTTVSVPTITVPTNPVPTPAPVVPAAPSTVSRIFGFIAHPATILAAAAVVLAQVQAIAGNLPQTEAVPISAAALTALGVIKTLERIFS